MRIVEWVNADTRFIFEGEMVYTIKGLHFFSKYFIGLLGVHDGNIFLIGEMVLEKAND